LNLKMFSLTPLFFFAFGLLFLKQAIKDKE